MLSGRQQLTFWEVLVLTTRNFYWVRILASIVMVIFIFIILNFDNLDFWFIVNAIELVILDAHVNSFGSALKIAGKIQFPIWQRMLPIYFFILW